MDQAGAISGGVSNVGKMVHGTDGCPVCLEAFNKSVHVQKTRCGHTFHKNCLKNVFELKPISSRYMCPMCRKDLRTLARSLGVRSEGWKPFTRVFQLLGLDDNRLFGDEDTLFLMSCLAGVGIGFPGGLFAASEGGSAAVVSIVTLTMSIVLGMGMSMIHSTEIIGADVNEVGVTPTALGMISTVAAAVTGDVTAAGIVLIESCIQWLLADS